MYLSINRRTSVLAALLATVGATVPALQCSIPGDVYPLMDSEHSDTKEIMAMSNDQHSLTVQGLSEDFSIVQKSDGNLQLLNQDHFVLWETGIGNNPDLGYTTKLQEDCNLVTRDPHRNKLCKYYTMGPTTMIFVRLLRNSPNQATKTTSKSTIFP